MCTALAGKKYSPHLDLIWTIQAVARTDMDHKKDPEMDRKRNNLSWKFLVCSRIRHGGGRRASVWWLAVITTVTFPNNECEGLEWEHLWCCHCITARQTDGGKVSILPRHEDDHPDPVSAIHLGTGREVWKYERSPAGSYTAQLRGRWQQGQLR